MNVTKFYLQYSRVNIVIYENIRDMTSIKRDKGKQVQPCFVLQRKNYKGH